MHKFFFDTRSDLHALLHRCKALAKAIKTLSGLSTLTLPPSCSRRISLIASSVSI